MQKKMPQILLFVTLSSIFAASCGASNRETDIAVIVALTQTAAALQQPQSAPQTEAATDAPTEVPAVVPPVSGYQPYDAVACTSLSDVIFANVGLTGSVLSPVPLDDYITGQNGSACQIAYAGTSATVPATVDLYASASSTLIAQGWVEDINYSAGGPTGLASAFRKDASLCLVSFERMPVDRALCNANEPIASCFAILSPEQITLNLTLTCSTLYP